MGDEPDNPDQPVVRGRDADAVEVRPADDELPVVARLVVEIRSDGKRTVARGAMEDVASGERVAIEARGASPMQLALQLARSMWQIPRLALRVRGLLGRGGKRER
jgi:hypothetical protein